MKKLTAIEIEQELTGLNGWSYNDDGILKNFVLKDFKEAIGVMVSIGEVAEQMNHHPEWFNVYNKLNIRLSTHDAGGVTNKDVELAQKIEDIIAQ